MKRIPNEVFWQNVRSHVGESRYNKIVESFTCFQNKPQTPENFRIQVQSELIPIMLKAACINGCKNTDAERAYQNETLEAYLEVAKEYPRLLTDPKSITEEENRKLKAEKIYPEYAVISGRFAQKGLCHSHPIDGFTCFCDEKLE